MKKNDKRVIGGLPGFTIIEVVLVLAIAGLIMMMVFIAVPALNRSQRNAQRKRDMSRILSAVSEYEAHNHGVTPWNGKLMTEGAEGARYLISHYVDEDVTFDGDFGEMNTTNCSEKFRDPNGSCYRIYQAANVQLGETCTGCNVPGILLNYDDATGGYRANWWGNGPNIIGFFPGTKCGEREWTFVTTGNPNSVSIAMVGEVGAWSKGMSGDVEMDIHEGAMMCIDNS